MRLQQLIVGGAHICFEAGAVFTSWEAGVQFQKVLDIADKLNIYGVVLLVVSIQLILLMHFKQL